MLWRGNERVISHERFYSWDPVVQHGGTPVVQRRGKSPHPVPSPHKAGARGQEVVIRVLGRIVGVQFDVFFGEIAGPEPDVFRAVCQLEFDGHVPIVAETSRDLFSVEFDRCS